MVDKSYGTAVKQVWTDQAQCDLKQAEISVQLCILCIYIRGTVRRSNDFIQSVLF